MSKHFYILEVYLKSPIRLSEEKIISAAEVMSRAFQEESLCGYTLPDSVERREKLPYVFEYVLRYGTLYGEVYTTSQNLEGIAIWHPYWEVMNEMTQGRILKAGYNTVYEKLGKYLYKQYYKRLRICDLHLLKLHKRHTANFSHWYIGPIGVDPKHQGKGYASKLLKPKLTQCEVQNIPCYLETHDEQNVPIYQHLGFDVVEEDIIPNTNLPIWAMMRK